MCMEQRNERMIQVLSLQFRVGYVHSLLSVSYIYITKGYICIFNFVE